jgi:hypothetical protein
VSDKQSHVPDTEGQPQRYPTTEQPLNGPKRSNGKALLALVGFLALLALLYWLGVEFLIDAD